MKIQVKINEEQELQQAATLPQIELLKGATGALIIVQIGKAVYSLSAQELVNGITNPVVEEISEPELVKKGQGRK